VKLAYERRVRDLENRVLREISGWHVVMQLFEGNIWVACGDAAV